MNRFRPQPSSPIGLDLGARQLRAAQLAGGPQRLLVASGSLTIPNPLTWSLADAQRVVDWLERRGFTGHAAVLALPPAAHLYATLRLPARDTGAPADEIARAQLADAARLDADALQTAWWDTPARVPAAKTAGERAALGVALRREHLEAVVAPLEAAGILVRAVDARVAALDRVTRTLRGGQSVAVLELTDDAAEFALIGPAGVTYQRTLGDGSLSPLRERLAARLGLDHDDVGRLWRWLAQPTPALPDGPRARAARDQIVAHADRLGAEIRSSIAYAAGKPGPAAGPVAADIQLAELVIVGEGARVGGLREALARATGLEARALGPVELGLPPDTDAGLALALGLAQYDYDPQEVPA